MMNMDNLDYAESEAKRFLKSVDRLRGAAEKDSAPREDKSAADLIDNESALRREKSLVKRSALDLRSALAIIRRAD